MFGQQGENEQMCRGMIVARILGLLVMGALCGCFGRQEKATEEDSLREKAVSLAEEFRNHLAREVKDPSSGIVKSYFVTEYIYRLGEGQADGIRAVKKKDARERILCVDLGGTSLKAGIASVTERGEIVLEEDFQRDIPRDPLQTKAMTVYEWIHSQILLFKASLEEKQVAIPRRGALTFSFPLRNEGKKIVLSEYTKEFKWKRVELKEDEQEEPLKELNKLTRDVAEFEVVINDAVATLLSAKCTDVNAILGIVLGTGTNGAYFELLDDVSIPGEPCTYREDSGPNPEEASSRAGKVVDLCALNTEWGGYSGKAVKAYQESADLAVDQHSDKPGHYLAEKMAGGLYFEKYVNKEFSEAARAYLEAHNFTGEAEKVAELHIPYREFDTISGKLRLLFGGNERLIKELSDTFNEIRNHAQRRREYILAGFIASVIAKLHGSSLSRPHYYIGLNGSGCTEEGFVSEISEKVNEILKRLQVDVPSSRIKYVYYGSASLVGAAFALLAKKQ